MWKLWCEFGVYVSQRDTTRHDTSDLWRYSLTLLTPSKSGDDMRSEEMRYEYTVDRSPNEHIPPDRVGGSGSGSSIIITAEGDGIGVGMVGIVR